MPVDASESSGAIATSSGVALPLCARKRKRFATALHAFGGPAIGGIGHQPGLGAPNRTTPAGIHRYAARVRVPRQLEVKLHRPAEAPFLAALVPPLVPGRESGTRRRCRIPLDH